MIRDELVSQGDLIEAIQGALERKGISSKIKSQIRAEIFHTLEDKSVPCPEKPRGVFIASELIRELMISFKLQNSLSVFSEEFGQPSEMNVDREFIGGELGLNVLGSDEKIPMLILIIQHLFKRKENLTGGMNDSTVVETDSVC